MTFLLVMTLGLPLLLLLLLGVKALQARIVSILALAPLPGLLLALVSGRQAEWSLTAPGGWAFALDRPSAMLLLASALLWSAAGACASRWLKGRENAPRFAMWWLLTLWGSLGVFAAADLAGFYVLYAAASLPAYGLIVWEGGAAEKRAGRLTLAAALLGEALLLAGFVLLAAGSPGQSLLIADCVAALAASPFRDAIMALLILGFGLKIGLVPLHGWMPLSYSAGPLFATAALSGATSKAAIIGLITFLPLGTALPGWGMALLALGLFSAFYGVIAGLFQTNPRSVLAYSSVSQLGQMAALLGAGLASGSSSAMVLVGFYALYHVLTKGGLFLAMDALAQTEGQRTRRFILVTAALAALGFAGLPLTGGALAKLAVKPLMGDGLAGLLFAAAAIGSTLLMLNFIRLIRANTHSPEEVTTGGKPREAWLFIFLLAMLLPWLLFDIVTGSAPAYAVSPGALLDLGWPIAAGLVISFGLAAAGLVASGPGTGLMRGDVFGKLWDMLDEAAPRIGQRFAGLEAATRQWTASTSLLILVILAFAILLRLAGA
jgi:formate hydrogenlyase subunit 3/multisubunit Na+/H+ antiporter MnhD subunit